MKRLYDVLKDCKKEEEVKSEFCKFFKMKINALKAIDHYTETILFEFKYDRNFKSAANVAAVVAQTMYYARLLKLGLTKYPLPPYICVVDKNEAFFIETKTYAKFYASTAQKYDWDRAASTPYPNSPYSNPRMTHFARSYFRRSTNTDSSILMCSCFSEIKGKVITMLFEPALHKMYAEEIRKAFPDWNGDLKLLNILLPVDALPFDRTLIRYHLKESTEKICELTVPSLRALFRGNGELVIDRTEFKEEYVPFFYPIESMLVAVGQRLPNSMITDDTFIEAFSAVRRRPDGKSVGYIHDIVWQLAANFLIRHVCSQNELEACFRRLEQSARTWHTSPTSANYLANIQPFL